MRKDPELHENVEQAFDSRRAVVNFDEIVANWTREAAEFRAAQQYAEFGLSYGSSARQVFDIFRPGPDPSAPLAVFVHGGYWQAFDNSYFSHFARGLLKRGIAVAMPTYDLAPGVPVATIVDQVTQACAFLAAHSTRPLIAIGHSAGAHLVAMAMRSGHIRRAVLLSGIYDLEPFLATQSGARLGLNPEDARKLSPLLLPKPGSGAARFMAGGDEASEFRRQSVALATHWCEPCDIVPGAHHFSILDQLKAADGLIVEAALA